MKKKSLCLFMALCLLVMGTMRFSVRAHAETRYKVTFYDRQGKMISPKKLADGRNPVPVSAGKKIILESLPGSSKETFMGWSLSPGKTVKPQFCAYYGKPVRGNLRVYSVTYPLSMEPDLTRITALSKTKYTKAVFVGDSRIVRTKRALVGQKGLAPARVEYIAMSNYDLRLYRMNLEAKLIASVKKDNKKSGPPIAVVFALGVNDLKHMDERGEARAVAREYAAYLKKLAGKLKKYNVSLFFMSVNPVNSSQILEYKKKYGASTSMRYEFLIRAFNEEITGLMPSPWKYMDTYKWLLNNGYSMVDGVHFTPKTCKRILDYSIKFLNKA